VGNPNKPWAPHELTNCANLPSAGQDVSQGRGGSERTDRTQCGDRARHRTTTPTAP